MCGQSERGVELKKSGRQGLLEARVPSSAPALCFPPGSNEGDRRRQRRGSASTRPEPLTRLRSTTGLLG